MNEVLAYAIGAASLVSYVRAKSDALGLPVTNGGLFGGLMERAERMILLGAGFLEPWLLVPVLWALFGLTMVTAVARFVTAWRAADGPRREVETVVPAPPPLAAWRVGRSATPSARWRARRDGADEGGATAEFAARWRARRQVAIDSRAPRMRLRRERAEAARAARGRARGQHEVTRSAFRDPGPRPGDRGA